MAYICLKNETSSGEYDVVQSITRTYEMRGYDRRSDAEKALKSATPLVDPDYPDMIRRGIEVSGIIGHDDEWEGAITWELYIPPTLNSEVITGTTGVTQANVKISHRHVAGFGPNGTPPPPFTGYINMTKDGVEGASWDIPTTSFQIKKYYLKGTYTLAWLANASKYVGLPNTLPWRGFASGEIKIVGISGSNDAGQYDEIIYRFSAAPTQTGIVIPTIRGPISVGTVLGWQYLHTVSQEVTVDGRAVITPVAAYVDELSQGVDINQLIP